VRIAAAALGLVLAAAGSVRADRPYARAARVVYLGRALAAVRDLGAERRRALEDELLRAGRSRCRATLGARALDCLLATAAAACGARPPAERAACHLAADVILTNQLAEEELVDEDTRARLLEASGDFRGAMRAELRLRHAALAAELALARPTGDLPARVDALCADRARDLAYQRCAAAIVWYVGSRAGPPAAASAP
jgi:hypothetical protein